MPTELHVVSLRIHPVKSTAITPVPDAHVGFAGLRGDREWMVVDEQLAMVSARELKELFGIQALPVAGDGPPAITLSAAGSSYTSRATGADVQVTMFTRPPMTVRTTDPGAGVWLQNVTGRAGLQLVWCAHPQQRRLKPSMSKPTDYAALQDSSPVSIASLASLRQLNTWIEEAGGEPVPIDRFRPNVVVDGDEPFAEDSWETVQIGGVGFRVAEPIGRCVMTLVDPADLARKHKEPIRTLSRHRKWDGQTWFCLHLIPDNEGEIAVGDLVIPQPR